MPYYISHTRRIISVCLTLLVICLTVSAQGSKKKLRQTDILDVAETYYGPDDYIFQGRKYVPENTQANGHPYLGSDQLKDAVIYCKGRNSAEVKANFNIHKELLIIQIETEAGGRDYLTLSKSLVDSFTIGTHRFINLRTHFDQISEKAFYEIVYFGEDSFVLDHNKEFIKERNNHNPHGKFTHQHSVLRLVNGNNGYNLSNKRSFLKLYPAFRKELKIFIRQNKIKYRIADRSDFFLLCKYVNDLMGANHE